MSKGSWRVDPCLPVTLSLILNLNSGLTRVPLHNVRRSLEVKDQPSIDGAEGPFVNCLMYTNRRIALMEQVANISYLRQWKFKTDNLHLGWVWKRLTKGKLYLQTLSLHRDSSPSILENIAITLASSL